MNFQKFVGSSCFICGRQHCCKPITGYYRYAVELFPFKKDKVPVARFLCGKTGKTFSLLPCQLIPYCQYTVDAMVGTLLVVYRFQQIGQAGYHGASLELDPDCFVTPYLIQTWAVLLLTGFLRGHPVLHEKFPLPKGAKPDFNDAVTAIFLYLQGISGSAEPGRKTVMSSIRHHYKHTGTFLFGKTSTERSRSP